MDNDEKSGEDNSYPKDWLRSEYKNHLMEDAVCEIVGQCQPANTTDVTVRLYEVQENDPNFERARKSANAILNNAKKAGKLKMIKRGIFVLNSYPDSFETTVIQNGHHKTYQAV